MIDSSKVRSFLNSFEIVAVSASPVTGSGSTDRGQFDKRLIGLWKFHSSNPPSIIVLSLNLDGTFIEFLKMDSPMFKTSYLQQTRGKFKADGEKFTFHDQTYGFVQGYYTSYSDSIDELLHVNISYWRPTEDKVHTIKLVDDNNILYDNFTLTR